MPTCISVERRPCQPTQLPQAQGGCRSSESTWPPSTITHERLPAISKQEQQRKDNEKHDSQGKNWTSHTPFNNNSFLQLPGRGDSKGGWQRSPLGRDLPHRSPGGHKCVRLPCEEAKVACAVSLVFLSNTCLTYSFLSEMLRKIFFKKIQTMSSVFSQS